MQRSKHIHRYARCSLLRNLLDGAFVSLRRAFGGRPVSSERRICVESPEFTSDELKVVFLATIWSRCADVVPLLFTDPFWGMLQGSAIEQPVQLKTDHGITEDGARRIVYVQVIGLQVGKPWTGRKMVHHERRRVGLRLLLPPRLRLHHLIRNILRIAHLRFSAQPGVPIGAPPAAPVPVVNILCGIHRIGWESNALTRPRTNRRWCELSADLSTDNLGTRMTGETSKLDNQGEL